MDSCIYHHFFFFFSIAVVFMNIVWLKSFTAQKELKQSNQCAASRAKPHVRVHHPKCFHLFDVEVESHLE